MSRKNIVVLFLSLTLLTVSILVIYLLWNVNGSNRNYTCTYEDLKDDILNFPTSNDSEVVVNETFEYFDENRDPRNVTIYNYRNYIITFVEDLDYNGLSYLTIKNLNNEVIYRNNKIIFNVTGSECIDNEIYNNGKSLNVKPIISNGLLYFISLSSSCYNYNEMTKKPYFNYNSIDLNSGNLYEKNIQSLKLKIDNYYDCE